MFTASVVVAPVEQAFYRYALEFIGRVTLATYPAVVMWAALGMAWAWQRGGLTRIGGALLFAAAMVVGADAWIEWIR